MKPICFIGARRGSKGVIRKNIRLIAGKPLIAHTIQRALESNIFQAVIVSTEDHEISSVAKRYGAEVPFIRPRKLATDKAGMSEVLEHGIKELYSIGYKFEIVVMRDCTVPFIRNTDIKGTMKLLKNKKCDGVYGVYKQHHNPYYNMLEPNSKGYLRLSKKPKKIIYARQVAPVVYQLNGLFTIDSQRFLRYHKILMPRVLPYEIPMESGLMIDTEFEFKIAEMMFKEKLDEKIFRSRSDHLF